MTFPSPHPSAQNSVTSNATKSSGVRPLTRTQHSAWGLPGSVAGAGRGLTPLSTDLNSESSNRSRNPSSASPFLPSFSSIVNSSPGIGQGRNSLSTSTSSNSPFPPLQTGSQQASNNQQILSPRIKTVTSSSQSGLVSFTPAPVIASQGGGGGGGSRSLTFSPSLTQPNLSSPTSNTFERSTFTGSGSSSAVSSSSSVSKIVVTQVFLLLGSITEKEGKVKWESQAEAIHKLVESHGMEVFSKYFRRLLVGNSPQIFNGINRNVENPANYQLLVQEMDKITQDLEQAPRIAEIIDSSEGDIFKDFDLTAFMDHFKLDSIAKTLLASAFRHVTKADLRKKAGDILVQNITSLIQRFGNTKNDDFDVSPSLLATAAFKFLQDAPPESRTENVKSQVRYALGLRYSKLQLQLPSIIRSALTLAELLETSYDLAKEIQHRGPRVTANLDAAKDVVLESPDIDEMQVAGALLFMILTPDFRQYSPAVFVSAVRECVPKEFDWARTVREFDIKGLWIDPEPFLALFNALLPIAQQDTRFDIQMLWSGRWQHPLTQISFVLAFLSLPATELDATTIPNLRQAYDPIEYLNAPEEVTKHIEDARKDTVISVDAVSALFELADEPSCAEAVGVALRVIETKRAFFLCAAAGTPKPWNTTQQNVMPKLLMFFLTKQLPEYHYVLHSLWTQDRSWVAVRLVEVHGDDPLKLPTILEIAQEQDWMDDLSTMSNALGIDLIALAHRKGEFDIEAWIEDKLSRLGVDFANALSRFLQIKAEDEMRTDKGVQDGPRTVNLAVKTVSVMLDTLDHHASPGSEELVNLQRACIQAFPRLINYGQGFDEIIEANGSESNRLSPEADAEMQHRYRDMYSGETSFREVIKVLQECKMSDDAGRQDLFACMIHGLFDEFICFGEYPDSPLQTTAQLFGGIIRCGLLSDLALRVALGMVFEAVRYPQDSPMYRFGLLALLTFSDRLPEWPLYCRMLAQVAALQDTDVYDKISQVINTDGAAANPNAETNAINGVSDGLGMANGDFDEFLSPDTNIPFKSINVDAASSSDFAEKPDEETQEKIIFFFNNVSEQNLSTKIRDLQKALKQEHIQWFARMLVEERAKLEPNLQQLYLDFLNLLGMKTLWAEVLRETYVSVQKMLNAESTMNHPNERKYLKSLATWLGSLTIARDKPIKHKNISFIELLYEGFQTERLLIVIPFTCNVLAQASKSVVFMPPNPWTVDILRFLHEIYNDADLKLNQKFEIEVLMKDFGIERESVDPSSHLKDRPARIEQPPNAILPDELEGFGDLTLGVGMNRPVRNARFSPSVIAATLPDLEPLLVFPPASGSVVNQNRLRQIVNGAIRRAVLEIIAPVVERSVTIATIATQNLIRKDFALESDEDRVRKASWQMAEQLSGSLALVTCKEPLRMSMNNYIRAAQLEMPDPGIFPEGAILMCVNDNLDTACRIVEQQAEERSTAEIEKCIEDEIMKRRQYRSEHGNEPYRDGPYNRWTAYIPDPFKQTIGGLNQEQMDIYLKFARQSRGPANHTQTSSADSGRQLPDVLQDAFSTVPNIPTPAERPAMPQQSIHQHPQAGRMLPPPLPNAVAQHQTNGFLDPRMAHDRIRNIMADILHLAKDAPERSAKDLSRDSPILTLTNQLWDVLLASPERETLTVLSAEMICVAMYEDGKTAFDLEVLAYILEKLCQLSPTTYKEVFVQFTNQDDEKILNVSVSVALLQVGLMDFRQVDLMISKQLHDRRPAAIDFLSDILDASLFNERPIALRADFANSLGALGQWICQQPGLQKGDDLVSKLWEWGMQEAVERRIDERAFIRQSQLRYIFEEWWTLCDDPYPSEKLLNAFISQLHHKQLLNSQEDMAHFLRLCIESCVEHYEQEELGAQTNEGMFLTDSLAKLVVFLVLNQGEADGAVKADKAAYMDSILSIIVLILNNHHVMRGEQFNQRVFFRLFSSIMCEWHDLGWEHYAQDRDMILVFAENLLAVEPRHIPSFTYSWLILISHRLFMPALLKLPDDEGWGPFASIMEAALSYVSELLKQTTIAPLAKDLYRGILRILVVLHHDFPEFLAENHYRLCNIIPAHCSQLRNLVLSAYPSSMPVLPDPFTGGLKVDRLEGIRDPPKVAGDTIKPLLRTNLKEVVDLALRTSDIQERSISRIIHAVHAPAVNVPLIHSVVLYIGGHAVSSALQKGGPAFADDSPPMLLLAKLCKKLQPEARYYLLGAVADQLRYPNSHTQFFSHALLHLFLSDVTDQQQATQQVTRVLLERMFVQRPHPWGLVITLMELIKNPVYTFWELPFVKAAPQIKSMFAVLFQHIQQSPRALA